MFRVNTANIITAQNISHRLSSMKDVLPTYEKYLTFCKDVIPYLESPWETMSIAIKNIKLDKDILIMWETS